jgi:hypothetical protein
MDEEIVTGAVENPTGAPTVEVNVVVEQPSEPTQIEETPVVQAEGDIATEEVAALDTPLETPADADDAGDGVSAPDPALESLAVERAEAEVEHARLENERLEIENDALRQEVEQAAEDQTIEVGVSNDGRSAETPDTKGSSETGHSDAAGAGAGDSAKSTSASGDNSPKSESRSNDRSDGRGAASGGRGRFKRGRN